MAPRGADRRPGLDALLKGVARREFDIVAAWSVCRLGRIPNNILPDGVEVSSALLVQVEVDVGVAEAARPSRPISGLTGIAGGVQRVREIR